MSNENNNTNPEGTQHHEAPKHESWFQHIVSEIKEEIAELVEEAQNDGGEFSALGNGHINIVHDHRHDNDKKEETPKAE